MKQCWRDCPQARPSSVNLKCTVNTLLHWTSKRFPSPDILLHASSLMVFNHTLSPIHSGQWHFLGHKFGYNFLGHKLQYTTSLWANRGPQRGGVLVTIHEEQTLEGAGVTCTNMGASSYIRKIKDVMETLILPT